MKDLLYLKDDQIKEFIQLLYYAKITSNLDSKWSSWVFLSTLEAYIRIPIKDSQTLAVLIAV